VEMGEGGEEMNGPVEVYHIDEAGGSMRNTSGVPMLQIETEVGESESLGAGNVQGEGRDEPGSEFEWSKQGIFTNLRLLTTFNC
jgi:hypothetical protein